MTPTFKFWHVWLFAILASSATLYTFFISPPDFYPVGGSIQVAEGSSVREVAEQLKQSGVIRSTYIFSIGVQIINPSSGVLANTYALPKRENVIELASRFASGSTGIEAVRVTIPEGLSSREIGDILKQRLTNFDVERFWTLAKPEEGYLFPDTYYFLPDTQPDTVIRVMKETFEKNVLTIEEKILASGRSVLEVVTMASIIEREARMPETRRIVADILWRRIEIGMPLQVDAVFGYILDKSGYAPSFDDLKIKSPYNTYLNRGLPPGPIANPSLDAILAALEPSANEYLYYLTGSDGKMYYAKTFDKHVANRVHLK